MELAELLEREQVRGDEVLAWARGRVAELLADLESDDELASWLDERAALAVVRDRGVETRAPASGLPPVPRGGGGRGAVATRATPPIPSVAAEPLEELDADDLVELDADELEVVDDPSEPAESASDDTSASDDGVEAERPEGATSMPLRVDDRLLGGSVEGVDLSAEDAEESGTVDTGMPEDEDENEDDEGDFDVDLD